ncbi:hypothetical protein VTK73DRAFT_6046 [Phialemonium thermophilum]|uniref:Mso1 N-terminal domain-containing protein n=1 Tax=Phialemonium thermophilum TaxID=223376 RepID=A0ABR3XW32_9PEZI
MTSWYSQLLTTTTTRITHLQRTLLASESDGDTEDDTHVCRVLRQYYTEKGRPFPPWLPPDPMAPPPAAPVYAHQQPSQVGSRYGGLSGPSATSLSSLWDSGGGNNSNNAAAAGVPQRQSPLSLRQGRSVGGGVDPGQRTGGGLPSSTSPFSRESSSSSTPPAGGSAQDRLKQRLWGGSKTTSPAGGGGGPFQPPQQQGSRYGSGSGSSDNYEDRFAPGGMYDGAGGGGGGGRSTGGSRPFMAANAPWATTESEYAGNSTGGRAGGGLPSGPRRGLPSGPRMR